MAFVTETRLKNVIDLPIALPATTLQQSDWIVAATVSLSPGQKLSLRSLTLQVQDSTVDVAQLVGDNLIVPNLGIVYAVLRQNYQSGQPGASGAIDTVFTTQLGITARSTVPLVITTPGYYSLLVANNTQAATSSNIPTGTSIDFTVAVTGQFRLELVGL